MDYIPRLIAWELTKKCNLKCIHCRANASDLDFSDELSFEECLKIIDNISNFFKPILILTGGEPMMREDLYQLAEYGTKAGLKIVMAPCGQFIDEVTIKKIISSGIKRVSLSIDGATEITHDNFRKVKGAFKSVINAANICKENGLQFQINSTITALNLHEIEEIFDLAVNLGAVSFHPFLLVPTGRGKDLKNIEISGMEYESTLEWIYKKSLKSGIDVKPTCAPHYYRIYRQFEICAGRSVSRDTHGINAITKGCLGGQGFAFISNTGKVQTCGFLNQEAGNLKNNNFNFKEIWDNSKLFNEIRNIDNYHGKCGYCEYRKVCGGCRARAYGETGNYLAEEPFCIYQPKIKKK